MRRKIIDDCRLEYLNDLFRIKIFFYNFLIIDATDRSKISSNYHQ